MARANVDEGVLLEKLMASALESLEGAVVQMHPRVGSAEPDFVVGTPEGGAFVIEVKAGLSASRLGSIAQLAAYRDEVQRASGDGVSVTPILVAVGPNAIDLREAGKDFGVEVIAGDEASTVADSLRARLSPGQVAGLPGSGYLA